MKQRWYYQVRGGHTHVRVFMNGGKCGDLCYRNEEFEHVMTTASHDIEFISETETASVPEPDLGAADQQAHDEWLDGEGAQCVTSTGIWHAALAYERTRVARKQ